MTKLDGKCVAVVGATGTIGRAACRELVAGAASVIGTGRDQDLLDQLRDEGVGATRLDLAPVATAAEGLRRACEATFGPRLDGLVLATGAHGPIGPTRTIVASKLTASLTEQLVSTIAILNALAPMLDRSESPSVVMLSGGGATGPRPNFTPYALAKIGTARLVENLAIEEPGWRVNAVAPGFIASKIHESTIEAGVERSGEDPSELRDKLSKADSPDRAARLIAFLVSDSAIGISGRLISAVWDPWEDPAWQSAMAKDPSLGRLRRIDGVQFEPINGG